jgi:hypothetical protein
MAKLLQDAGFAFWDLGQEIPYKVELGASLMPREEFLAEFRAARGVVTALRGGSGGGAGAGSAQAVPVPLHSLPRATAPAVLL